jgi:hypothetical protein
LSKDPFRILSCGKNETGYPRFSEISLYVKYPIRPFAALFPSSGKPSCHVFPDFPTPLPRWAGRGRYNPLRFWEAGVGGWCECGRGDRKKGRCSGPWNIF